MTHTKKNILRNDESSGDQYSDNVENIVIKMKYNAHQPHFV